MTNPLYPVMLNEMGNILKLSRQSLEVDIKSITEYWETSLKTAKVDNREAAIFLLTACVDCYLRGRGIHLSSQKTVNTNRGILVSLVTLICIYAWKQPHEDLPAIHLLLPLDASISDRQPVNVDILDEADRILHNYP